ncbi:MAG TPA: glycogen-binding domain-containing protein [Gemmatimonadales bacterium]
MTVPRTRWTAIVGAVGSIVTAHPLAAQVSGTVELGVSTVRYDEFLPSGAGSVGAAVSLERPRSTLTGRGTLLMFQSGNVSLQGSVAASALTASTSRWRGELWGTAGANRYANYASFWHAVGGVRVHLIGQPASAWVDGSAGLTSFGEAGRPVVAVAAGLWTRRHGTTLTLSAAHTQVGDTVYTDVGAVARGRRGQLELEAALAARLLSRGGGHGVFGEASGALNISRRAAIVLAGGRYPTDPIRGSISGRYLTASVRLRTFTPRAGSLPRPAQVPVFATGGANGSSGSTAAWLEIQPAGNGWVRLRVHAPDVESVEVAGDFTDWQPVPLLPAGAGRWEVDLAIARGAHRINVRLNGGRWVVPVGATRAADDYGGEIGIFVVP